LSYRIGVMLITIAVIWGAGACANTLTQDDPATQGFSDHSGMSWWQAAVLGIVEGATEYLPVSSTGHLLVAQRAIGIDSDDPREKEAANAYVICIQAGAIVAVMGLYRRRMRQILVGLAGRDPAGMRLAACLMAGLLPAAIIGLLISGWIKERLFGPLPIIAAWAVGGVVILLVAYSNCGREVDGRRGRTLEELTWKMAVVIGIAQCIAMWPGVSRSLVTIVGGTLVGLSLVAAVEFSFLLGLATLGAATAYDAYIHGSAMAEIYSPKTLAVGFLFAFLVAVLAIKWMVRYLGSHGLQIFGYYRIGIAIVVGVLLIIGII